MTRKPLVVDRRALLAGVGGAIVAGCASRESDNAACPRYPRQTEGPFYLESVERQDITEGLAGAALMVRISVVDGANCAAVEGAVVEIWHADAGGVYSGFAGQLGGVDTTGEDFLRGAQRTNREGVAEFGTVYPGWYPGRTTHIHVKVLIGENELTSQLYFPEAVTAEIYASGAYASHGQKDTANEADGIMDAMQLMTITGDLTEGYVATITLAV